MPDFYPNGGEESATPRNWDADIGKAMDLIWDIPSYPMYYPNIVFKKDSTKTKPNLLIIGDSFTWLWIDFYKYIPEEFNEKTSFWYYNRELSWKGKRIDNPMMVSKLNLKEQTLHRDFILIVFNEVNLNKGGYQFIEQMYDLLSKENKMKN